MPFVNGVYTRTDGVRTGTTICQQEKSASIGNRADLADVREQDMATGLNLCRLRDGSNDPTADLPMAGFKHTGAAAATDTGDYAEFDQMTAAIAAAIATLSASIADQLSVSGMVKAFAGSSAPTGWLLCYGQAISRTDFADLFTAISTTYGAGDASTTFNVPDLRGRGIFGVDNMGGSAASRVTSGGSGITGTTLGASGGEEAHTLIIDEMPSHDHTVTDPGHTHTYSNTNTNARASGSFPMGFNDAANSQTTGSSTTGITVEDTGGDGAHNNMPPAMMLNWIIKT